MDYPIGSGPALTIAAFTVTFTRQHHRNFTFEGRKKLLQHAHHKKRKENAAVVGFLIIVLSFLLGIGFPAPF